MSKIQMNKKWWFAKTKVEVLVDIFRKQRGFWVKAVAAAIVLLNISRWEFLVCLLSREKLKVLVDKVLALLTGLAVQLGPEPGKRVHSPESTKFVLNVPGLIRVTVNPNLFGPTYPNTWLMDSLQIYDLW